jgi:hypothetical protein
VHLVPEYRLPNSGALGVKSTGSSAPCSTKRSPSRSRSSDSSSGTAAVRSQAEPPSSAAARRDEPLPPPPAGGAGGGPLLRVRAAPGAAPAGHPHALRRRPPRRREAPRDPQPLLAPPRLRPLPPRVYRPRQPGPSPLSLSHEPRYPPRPPPPVSL